MQIMILTIPSSLFFRDFGRISWISHLRSATADLALRCDQIEERTMLQSEYVHPFVPYLGDVESVLLESCCQNDPRVYCVQ